MLINKVFSSTVFSLKKSAIFLCNTDTKRDYESEIDLEDDCDVMLP